MIVPTFAYLALFSALFVYIIIPTSFFSSPIVGITSFVISMSASVPVVWVYIVRSAETVVFLVAASYIHKRKYFNITFKIRNSLLTNTFSNKNQITYLDSELRNRTSEVELDA